MKTGPLLGSAVTMATPAMPKSSRPPPANIHLRFMAVLLFASTCENVSITDSRHFSVGRDGAIRGVHVAAAEVQIDAAMRDIQRNQVDTSPGENHASCASASPG